MGKINTRLIDFITVKVPILQLGQNARKALTAAPDFVQDKISRIAVVHVGINELTDS
jgi:hypothetical protein